MMALFSQRLHLALDFALETPIHFITLSPTSVSNKIPISFFLPWRPACGLGAGGYRTLFFFVPPASTQLALVP